MCPTFVSFKLISINYRRPKENNGKRRVDSTRDVDENNENVEIPLDHVLSCFRVFFFCEQAGAASIWSAGG